MPAGLPWDHPDSDPLADIAAFAAAGPDLAPGDRYVLKVGARAYDVLTERLGHEPTPADLPPGCPGRWDRIERLDPC
jgi:hypothetical protein